MPQDKRDEVFGPGFTRREFMKAAGAGAAFVAAGGLAPQLLRAAAGGAGPTVAVVRAPGLLKLGKADQLKKFKAMIDTGLAKASGQSAPTVLKKHFSGVEFISMKVNPVGGKLMGANPRMAQALCEQLMDVGVKENSMIIWDRADKELLVAGYKLNKSKKGVRCVGTDVIGYDEKEITSGSVTALFSRILTRYTDALINLPVMKTHGAAGISIALKNHYGSFDRPNKCHANGCDPFIADVNAVSLIKDKTRLIVVDATRPQYNKGPMPVEEFRWDYEGIVVGFDPVAVDAVCANIIAQKAKNEKAEPWKNVGSALPRHLLTAQSRGLGVADLKKIKVITTEI
jgi:uncharacterized protein (DUF362 family)